MLPEDFISWQNPIYRDRLAALGRTDNPQGSEPARPADYLDIVAGNNFATAQTKTFVIERIPDPKLIQSPQSGEFVAVGQLDRMEQWHGLSMPEIDKSPQSAEQMIT